MLGWERALVPWTASLCLCQLGGNAVTNAALSEAECFKIINLSLAFEKRLVSRSNAEALGDWLGLKPKPWRNTVPVRRLLPGSSVILRMKPDPQNVQMVFWSHVLREPAHSLDVGPHPRVLSSVVSPPLSSAQPCSRYLRIQMEPNIHALGRVLAAQAVSVISQVVRQQCCLST